jgi:MFS family permease
MNYTAIIYAQDVFGSDLLAGIGFGLCFGPPIVLGWIAGVYSDRIPPSYLVVGSQLIFAVAAGLLMVLNTLADTSHIRIPLYVLTTFLVGVGWSFIAPSRLAALAQIVPKKALHQASVIFNLLIMIGFGLAPIIIATAKVRFGWNGVFMVILGLFLTATLLLAGIKTKATTASTRSVLSQTREGLSGVLAAPLLRQLMVCSMLIYALMGVMQVLLPRFASSILGFGEMQRGLFLGVLAISLILGGILCMVFSKRLPAGLTIIIGIILGAVAIFATAYTNNFATASFALMCAGLTGGYAASLIVAGLQQHAPDHIRGRVMSVYTITSQVIPAFSGLTAGILSQYLGVMQAMHIGAIVVVTLGIFSVFKLSAVRSYTMTEDRQA